MFLGGASQCLLTRTERLQTFSYIYSVRIVSEFLKRLHLDKQHLLLTGRAVQFIKQYFDDLDARGNGELDDMQFVAFMSMSTNLNEQDIYKVFDMFDVDHSGSIEFDEFYLLISILNVCYGIPVL